jgi:hypothetical protein
MRLIPTKIMPTREPENLRGAEATGFEKCRGFDRDRTKITQK